MRTPAALLLVALLVVGCGAAAPPAGSTAASPSPSPAAASDLPTSAPPASPSGPSATPASSAPVGDLPLLTVGFRGGHCRTGPCDRTVAIDRDGAARQTQPEPADLGRIPADRFQALQQALSLADFEALGSRPFTGECPVNFDGQELIYTFYGSTGEIRLASCEVELDPSDPLFVAIENALAAVSS